MRALLVAAAITIGATGAAHATFWTKPKVPEIEVASGLGALGTLGAVGALLWERRRRQQ